jgi:hypothetical protein
VTGIDVEESNLSGDDGGEGNTEDDGSTRGRVFGAFLDFLAEVARILFSELLGYRLSRIAASFEAAQRRLRVLGVLALTFLVFGILTSVVWFLVGVAFLVERFPVAADPVVFAAGGAIGYLIAVVAGIVYSG